MIYENRCPLSMQQSMKNGKRLQIIIDEPGGLMDLMERSVDFFSVCGGSFFCCIY